VTELIKDGLAIKLTNGVTIPLEYNRSLVFYNSSKMSVLDGSHDRRYELVKASTRRWEFDLEVENYGDLESLKHIMEWFRSSTRRSVRVSLRGWNSSLLFNISEVASFDFFYRNPNPQGIQVLLKDGRRLLLEKNQHIVFYNCLVDEVEDELEEFKRNDAPWNNPIEFSLDYSEDIYTVGSLNDWVRFSPARSVAIKLVGVGGNNLYPVSDFEYFELE